MFPYTTASRTRVHAEDTDDDGVAAAVPSIHHESTFNFDDWAYSEALAGVDIT